ncbi:MAG: phytanoyl-CoA dioxygenase family protein [Steroidobacteraceae bacterium]
MTSLNFHTDGAEIRKGILSRDSIEAVKSEISLGCEQLRRHGIRNLEKRFSSVAQLASSPDMLNIANELLQSPPRLVRALFFDKTPEANWFVAWHQDRTVTLNQRCEMSGWGPWSFKDGVHHVQPPRAVLDKMVTIRLHIDDADEKSGCLNIIPGSHRQGILAQREIEQLAKNSKPVACVVAAGDAMIMRPHVLHSSSKSQSKAHRRVVHLEYSSYALPPNVDWA